MGLIGHVDIINALKQSVSNGKVWAAYLFTGPEGVGKKKAALYFASLINCQSQSPPCGTCVPCTKIQNGISPDVHIVVPSGKSRIIGIEAIREVKRLASMKPFESVYKVFIIDGADLMNQESANSFLKTLEEALPDSKFILLASKPQRVLPTILSRVSVFKFGVIPEKDIVAALETGYGVSAREAAYLARFSEGCIGKAISFHTGEIFARKNQAIDRLKDFILSRNNNVNRSWEYTKRETLEEDLSFFLTWFRDILVVKAQSSLDLLYNSDRIDEIRKAAGYFSFEALDSAIKKILELQGMIGSNVNVKIIGDSFLAAMSTLTD